MAKLLFVFFLLGLRSVFCTEDLYEYNEKFHLPGYDLKGIERKYREQERRVERPCPVYDLLCIRRYLARHSDCKIAEGPVPDPFYKTQSTSYTPTFNLTFTVNELSFTGLTGTLSEFSVNRKSELTTMKIDFLNVTIRANKIYFRFHRRGQEPEVTSSNLVSGQVTFPSFSITTVFKGIDHLRLADSESVISLDELGAVALGPELAKSLDPSVLLRFADILKQPLTFELEALLTVTPFIASTYIQNVLCDFGLKLN